MTISTLHAKAKRAVQAGEHKFREAAEALAEAKKLGATQQQSAKAIGRSQSWVAQLLAWRKGGYKGGAFDRSHKARIISRANNSKPKPTARASMTEAEALAKRERIALEEKFFGVESKHIPAGARKELLAALAMLAKSNDTAAILVERCRARLNLKWDDLLVPAEADSELSELKAA